MSFVVVRHGESLWNKENRFTGWKDVELSDKGREEARTTGVLLKETKFDRIFSSPLKRTTETLELILEKSTPAPVASNPPPHNIEYSKALIERDYGSISGKNKDDLRTLHGEEQIQKWRRGYEDTPPGGESLQDVVSRVGTYYDDNIAPSLSSKTNTLIVSHGNTIRALFVHLGIYTPNTVETLEIPTGTPIVVDVEKKTFHHINKYEVCSYQIIDSRGNPTIETKCYNKITNKCVGKGSCPSGASCGSSEMLELRDNDKLLYKGKSVFEAIDNIHKSALLLQLNNKTCCSLETMDAQLQQLDTSELKSNIGGNAITAMSFCFADTAARLHDEELYEYLARTYKTEVSTESLPIPLVNIINGGKHSVTGELKIQEFMIFVDEKHDTLVQNRIICETYHTLKQILVERYGEGAKSIGDEGGFCPPIYTGDEAISVIEEAIEKADYVVGTDVYIALDCAASEFYDETTKTYEVETGLSLSGTELVDYYIALIDRHPALKSIEDAFHETDYMSWIEFNKKCGDRVMIVGDDLFTSNPKLIKQGIAEKWANALLLKVNQIGTITESIDGAKLMFSEGNNVIVSHRSGETTHSFLIDIAVGIGAKYVKIGSPCRGERVVKFNRLVEIYHELSRL
jgi:enolase